MDGTKDYPATITSLMHNGTGRERSSTLRHLSFKRWLLTLLGGEMTDTEKRQRAQVIDTRAELLLREVEAKAKLAEIKARTSAGELASLHLSTWAGAYMTLMVVIFLGACLYLPGETISVVAGLITLVVTSLSNILKSIVDTGGSGPNDTDAS